MQEIDPTALIPLRGGLVIASIRCVITYVLVPLLFPIIGVAGWVAAPFAIALSLLAIGLSLQSLRRVWVADWRLRWPYTAFIGTVVLVLVGSIVWDVASLTA